MKPIWLYLIIYRSQEKMLNTVYFLECESEVLWIVVLVWEGLRMFPMSNILFNLEIFKYQELIIIFCYISVVNWLVASMDFIKYSSIFICCTVSLKRTNIPFHIYFCKWVTQRLHMNNLFWIIHENKCWEVI